MKLLRVGAAVLNQTPLDWEGNKARVLSAIAQARAAGVSLLCLPELCLTGYGCEDAFQSPGVLDTAWQVLQELVPATEGLIVSVGLPLVHNNGIYNTACLLADGEILGFVAKQYLAGDGLHYEPRWFKAWPAGVRTHIERDGARFPLGDLGFEVGGVRIGFEICEDAWVARRPGGQLALRGIDVIVNPSASHFAFDKHEIRQRFVLEGSRAFSVSYLYANLLGNEAGRVLYDGGALIASGGRMLACGPRFSYQDVVLTSAVIDVEATRMQQWRSASFEPDLEGGAGFFVRAPFGYPALAWQPPSEGAAADWERGPSRKEEEFARAVALGLFDYMRKSRSQGFVLSLSGGADSSAVATLIHLMVRFAASELGWEALRAKLGHVRALAGAESPAAATAALLTCAYQATRHSGPVTRAAAEGLASALGARYMSFDIEALVEGYTAMVEQGLGRALNWEQDDLALQNIQARVRSPGIWMVANVLGALLLTTSNRSEAAVGYATMDGDTSGGLCPIGGIDKAFLRHWLRWMEAEGPRGVGAIPSLRLVNEQQPTAELRPAERVQTDEKDLMPYEVLDAIERAAIRDKQMPLEVFARMRVLFGAHYDAATLGFWVERFFRLWSHNQWKRERYAPSFHLDDENLDPKTWCRFPILSGGFERELGELRAALARLAQPAAP